MDRCSDEPTRLAEYITKLFRLDNGSSAVRTGPDAVATPIVGADAQDDCAVLRMTGAQDLVVGSDYVRGPKFRLYEMGFLTLFDLGYYLVAANVSDVAAMGARPVGLLSIVRYPPDMADDEFVEVLSGIKEAAADFRCPSIGGDIGSAERLFLSATALGVCRPGRALLRKGANPGDILCVTGPTGTAGAAMAYLRSGRTLPEIERLHREKLLRSWQRPVARVDSGVQLGESDMVTSCQDTSDGLKAAIMGIAEASRVGFRVDRQRLPVAPEVGAVCELMGLDPIATIMGDSVDFELAFTVAEADLPKLHDRVADVYPIGVATRERSVSLVDRGAVVAGLPGQAWRHSSDPVLDEAEPRTGH